MSEPRIIVEKLGKRFARRSQAAARGERRLVLGGFWSRPKPEQFWALCDVSFSVAPGEMLGVIGPNGAGKSTLLTLLSGIVEATTGNVTLHGRLGALLDLGGGFVHDLTGRENAILAGVVAGLTRQEVGERLDAIVAFAEVGSFLDQPVRTYSTGMRMRLAFSVSVHTEPEILLVDEYLSVGDLSFQSRCRTRIAELRAAGCTMVVVSHGLNDLRSTCDRVLWLDSGEVAALDVPNEVIARYEAAMHERTLELTPATSRISDGELSANQKQQRLGSREVEITRVALTPSTTVCSGGPLVVEIGYTMRHAASSPIFGVSITREDGLLCVDTNTEGARVQTSNLAVAGTITFSIPRLDLAGGRYFLNVGIYETNWRYAYDFHWHAYPFFVDGTLEHKGALAPACQWSFTRNSPSQARSLLSEVTAAS